MESKQSNNRELFVFFTKAFPGMQILGTATMQSNALLLDGNGYCCIHDPFLVVGTKVQEGNIATAPGGPQGAQVGVELRVTSPFAAGAPLYAQVAGFHGPLRNGELRHMYSEQVRELRFRASGLVKP